MSDGPARPGYEDVLSEIERIAASAGEAASTSELGQSVRGRSIPCLTLTDPAAPAEDKQHVLIVASQHGSEESGRALALALADFAVRLSV
ncbi:hypothetical protein LCGC14_1840320, partial [marine sediment metagenome]